MRSILLVLACLAFAGRGRRAQFTRDSFEVGSQQADDSLPISRSLLDSRQAESNRRTGVENPLQSFAFLLLASAPAAGWQFAAARPPSSSKPFRSNRAVLMGSSTNPPEQSSRKQQPAGWLPDLPDAVGNIMRDASTAVFFFFASFLLAFSAPEPSFAVTDGAKIGTCLIANCPTRLARCVTDPTCLANLACIQTCTGKPDEGDCQVACGDKFSNEVVADFTKCAVSEKACVPQRQDDGSYPVPKSEALVKEFNPAEFTGPWYISAGLNPAFDIFDCQLHKFESPEPGKLVGNLQWRIKDPVAGTQFVTRYTVQEFKQDPKEPGILYNHDNEFLHYQDDWYVLSQKKNEYVLIYYRGSNDAWDGYGGAVIYTTAPTLDKKYYGEIDAALQKVGLKFSQFKLTDNTCKERESRLEEIEADLVFVESRIATGVQLTSKKIAEEAVLLEKEVEKDVVALEKEVVKDAVALENEVVKDAVAIEKAAVKKAAALEKVVEDDAKALERELEKDVFGAEKQIAQLFPR